MKKKILYIILGIILLLGYKEVFAKDIVYSIKKYEDAKLFFIKDSYDLENHVDGMVTAGTFLKKTEEEDTYHSSLIIKYKSTGKVLWTYFYEEEIENEFIDLEYTYNEEGQIDGYLVVLQKKSIDKIETILLKLNLEGKLLWEKPLEEIIQKIVPTYTEDNKTNGFIAFVTRFDKIYLTCYDQAMNILWQKEYPDIEYKELVHLENEFLFIKNAGEETIDIIKINLLGEESVLLSNIKKEESLYLQERQGGFLLYGVTKNVKLSKGDKSYYILNYDSEGTLLWESIGEIGLDAEEKLILLPNNESYLLLYKNKIDSSYEVIEFNQDGNYQKKVKKIKNDYYDFENFSIKENVIYFVGQINCPEEDNCDYKNNSLFLISDEDKVIEVKDNDSEKIMLGITFFIILLTGVIIMKRKRRMKR